MSQSTSSLQSVPTNINSVLDDSAGKGQGSEGITIGALVASFGTAAVIFGVCFLAFNLMKDRFPRIYQPRTYLVPERERTSPPPRAPLAWILPVFRTSNAEFIQKCGLDAYFFVRYLRMLLKIFIPLGLVILPILLPLNEIGGRGPDFAEGKYSAYQNVTGVDLLAWGNITPAHTHRYWAHLVLAIAVVAYCSYTFYNELREYIDVRQTYLTSPQHRLRASATTVLINAIPDRWMSAEALDGLYDVLPGGVRNIWINRDFDELLDKVKKRNTLADKLEVAETALIIECAKAYAKKHGTNEKDDDKKKKIPAKEADKIPLSHQSPVTPRANPPATVNGKNAVKDAAEYPHAYNANYDEDDDGEPLWKKYVKPKDRDTMRLPIFGWEWMISLPLLGKKVDTIYYCRKEIARLNVEIEDDQQKPEKYPLMNSAFVQFNNQVAAHLACQAPSHNVPKQMAPRLIEISPDDVIWDNMAIKWWERYLRTGAVFLVVVALVVGWAFPVTFTGLISQLTYLGNLTPKLNWINKLPTSLKSVIQGVLPPALLAGLMALLPVILRFLSKMQGIETGMGVEQSVQNYYFAFLFVQVFLVVSISSGITTVLTDLAKSIGNAPALLAANLPKASNYFFSYMLLQAFSTSGGALVQVGGLATWLILSRLLDTTPRQKWARQTKLPQIQWGTFFPVYTNLACIGLIYSVISPLIIVFNLVTFSLFWVVFRYNTLYVTQFRFDTGGLLFPRAINQLFTGLYVMELCLVGLFFLVRDDKGDVACTPQGIIMVVVAILTMVFQYLLNEAFSPLFKFLPLNLEDDAVIRDEEFARALEKEPNHHHEEPVINEQGIELQSKKRTAQDHLRRFHDVLYQDTQKARDLEAARQERAEALFSHMPDEIEDLTADERDRLVQRAFQHSALRAKRPVIWIPRDELGVSDDEVYRTQQFSKHIWITNDYASLDDKHSVVYRRSPPDLSEIDLIPL